MPSNLHGDLELNQHHKVVLEGIGWYYNGSRFTWNGKTYRLGLAPPPQKKPLIRGGHAIRRDEPFDWNVYKKAVEDLYTYGYFQHCQIAHKYINWAPKQKARQIMEDELSPDTPAARAMPKYYDYNGGLVGDLNESLRHRWGVEVGAIVIVKLDPEDYWIYPGSGAAQRFDIKWILNGQLFAEEMLTDHHAKQAYGKKYLQAADSEAGVRFLFQSGDLAKAVLNYWHESDDIPCELKNFPLSDSHAFKHARQYVYDSVHSPKYDTRGLVGVDTVHRQYEEHINN